MLKPDYAKWMMDDPRVNFAISQRGHAAGIDHLGVQAENQDELAAIGPRPQSADALMLAEQGTTCCHVRSDKYRVEDLQGVRWESFLTHGDATAITAAPADLASGTAAACGGPVATAKAKPACAPNSNCC